MTADDLHAAGWTQTRSGRWTHDAYTLVNGRRSLFTLEAALAEHAENLKIQAELEGART
jgi:hypothetical protein